MSEIPIPLNTVLVRSLYSFPAFYDIVSRIVNEVVISIFKVIVIVVVVTVVGFNTVLNFLDLPRNYAPLNWILNMHRQ